MCNENKEIIQQAGNLAPLILYKTKADYSNNIPIVLNDNKDKIVSYPSIKDVTINGQFARPYKLRKGFLLDNIGISVNTVYTSFTYEEYSRFKDVPTIEEFYKRIIDKDPFIAIYKCGKRTEFKSTDEVNLLIKNKLKGCTKLH